MKKFITVLITILLTVVIINCVKEDNNSNNKVVFNKNKDLFNVLKDISEESNKLIAKNENNTKDIKNSVIIEIAYYKSLNTIPSIECENFSKNEIDILLKVKNKIENIIRDKLLKFNIENKDDLIRNKEFMEATIKEEINKQKLIKNNSNNSSWSFKFRFEKIYNDNGRVNNE